VISDISPVESHLELVAADFLLHRKVISIVNLAPIRKNDQYCFVRVFLVFFLELSTRKVIKGEE